MKYASHTALLIIFVLAAACGEPAGEGPLQAGEDPGDSARDLPAQGPPADDAEHEAPPPPDEVPVEDPNPPVEPSECCPVVFALAPTYPEQVLNVVLRGSAQPLDMSEGFVLEESEGVWSDEICMPPDYLGSYYYEVSLMTPGSDEGFLSEAHNPYAPTIVVDGQQVNGWYPAEDCTSLDGAVHGQISE